MNFSHEILNLVIDLEMIKKLLNVNDIHFYNMKKISIAILFLLAITIIPYTLAQEELDFKETNLDIKVFPRASSNSSEPFAISGTLVAFSPYDDGYDGHSTQLKNEIIEL